MHNIALFQVNSFEKIPKLLHQMRAALGDFVTAFEYMDTNSIAVAHQIAPSLLSRYIIIIHSDINV